MPALVNASIEERKRKKDLSAARADSFAGAKEKKKRRPAPVAMTVFCLIWRESGGRALVSALAVPEWVSQESPASRRARY
jgi:hypothetical protein